MDNRQYIDENEINENAESIDNLSESVIDTEKEDIAANEELNPAADFLLLKNFDETAEKAEEETDDFGIKEFAKEEISSYINEIYSENSIIFRLKHFIIRNKASLIVPFTAVLFVFAFYFMFSVLTSCFAKEIVIISEDKEYKTTVYFNQTVSDALAKANIGLDKSDSLSLPLNYALKDGDELMVFKARNVIVNDGKKSVKIFTGLNDENEILSQAGMEKLEDGYILRNLATEAEPRYYRLHEDDVITFEEKSIDYKTVYKKDKSLKKGTKKVIQDGKKGIKVTVKKTSKSKKGKEKTETLFSYTSVAPTEKIVAINGAGIVETSAGDFIYKKKITVSASGYCSCFICCGKTNGITASGKKAKANHTIAASSAYSFGTKFYIPYYDSASNNGIFVVEDRGGAITDNRIDIYFSSHIQALRFGRRKLTVYVLE